jgi:hypothetical protein
VDDGRYILSLGTKTVDAEVEISIMKNDKVKKTSPLFNKKIFVAKLGYRNQKKKIVKIGENADLKSLFSQVENYLDKHYPQVLQTVQTKSPWLSERASEGYLNTSI